jgi:methyl-accepting chemotaxis protein/ligand-binding sensor domain-containing protein
MNNFYWKSYNKMNKSNTSKIKNIRKSLSVLSILPRVILIIHFIVFLQNTSYSQTLSSAFDMVTIKDGLSQSTVNYIIQDRHGFMWFATYGGLNKYDGYSFTVYQNDENDSTSLSSNNNTVLFEDNDGFIWVVNNGNEGLDKFDPETGKFIHYKNDPKDPTSISSNMVHHVTQDKAGNIWVCANNALNLVVKEKGKRGAKTSFKRFMSPEGNNFVRAFEDSKGNMVLFGKFIYLFNRQTMAFTKSILLPAEGIISYCEDKKGDIIVGTQTRGVFKLEWDKDSSIYRFGDNSKINPTPQNRTYVTIDNFGIVWIGTETKGLFRYNPETDQMLNFVPNKLDSRSLSDANIYSLYIDRFGVLWIGTYSQGLCKYDIYRKDFTLYKSIPGNMNTMSGNVISGITSNNPNELWVGSRDGGGVNRFVFKANEEPRVFHYLNNPNDINNIINISCLCLLQRKSGEIWIGSQGFVSRMIPEEPGSNKSPQVTRYPMGAWTFDLFEDSKGVLWGGTWGNGLWRFDDGTGQFIPFRNDPNNPTSLCDNVIWSIGEDNHGNLWIGGHSEGLSIMPAGEREKANPKFVTFRYEKGNKKSLSNNTIGSICRDRSGTMWLATDKGLNKFIDKNNILKNLDENSKLEFKSYSKIDGLPSNGIVGVVEDKAGNIWVSTTNGISRFNVADSTFANYYESDGLQSNEFWHNASYINSEGRIFFGGPNGFNAFYPDKIKANPFLPVVVITDLKILNKSVKPGQEVNGEVVISKPIYMTPSISLSHKNNILTIEFAGLHYAKPSSIKYAYFLENFDTEWNYTDKRTATYTNLDPGTYTFRVKATNNDGVWNEKDTSLIIEVRPPWWATIWFRILALASIVGLIAWFFSYRTRQLKENQKILEFKVSEATDKVNAQNSKLIEAQAKLTNIMDDVKNQLGRASEELLDASNNQASTAEEISASMEEIASELTENASSMLQMLETVKNVEEKAGESVKIVSNTLNSINDISESIGFVSEFARMTNLLSLNAAIEAARAGVHGRSFAVVATQVKKLADQSAEVAVKIQKSSENGQKLSQEANTIIVELSEIINGIVNTITEMNLSIQNQSQGANAVNESIVQMSMYISNTSELAGKLDAAINSLTVDE